MSDERAVVEGNARTVVTEWWDAGPAADAPDADERRLALAAAFAADAVLTLPRRTVTGGDDACAYVAAHPRIGGDQRPADQLVPVTWQWTDDGDGGDVLVATTTAPGGQVVRWSFVATDDGRLREISVRAG